jgi:hypothetical protein
MTAAYVQDAYGDIPECEECGAPVLVAIRGGFKAHDCWTRPREPADDDIAMPGSDPGPRINQVIDQDRFGR